MFRHPSPSSQGTLMQRYVSLLLLAYCTSDSPEPSLLTQCSTLTSDATLISLFRSNAAPLPCPIKGPLEFTYSQGEGECNSPRSRAEACTQDSRLLLRYQACANVHSSESVGQYFPRVIIFALTCDDLISHTDKSNVNCGSNIRIFPILFPGNFLPFLPPPFSFITLERILRIRDSSTWIF